MSPPHRKQPPNLRSDELPENSRPSLKIADFKQKPKLLWSVQVKDTWKLNYLLSVKITSRYTLQ